MSVKGKIIFSPCLANYLLKHGHQIINLKPNRNNPEVTVYVFEATDSLFESIALWNINYGN